MVLAVASLDLFTYARRDLHNLSISSSLQNGQCKQDKALHDLLPFHRIPYSLNRLVAGRPCPKHKSRSLDTS